MKPFRIGFYLLLSLPAVFFFALMPSCSHAQTAYTLDTGSRFKTGFWTSTNANSLLDGISANATHSLTLSTLTLDTLNIKYIDGRVEFKSTVDVDDDVWLKATTRANILISPEIRATGTFLLKGYTTTSYGASLLTATNSVDFASKASVVNRAPVNANFRIKNGNELQIYDVTSGGWRSMWFQDDAICVGPPEDVPTP